MFVYVYQLVTFLVLYLFSVCDREFDRVFLQVETVFIPQLNESLALAKTNAAVIMQNRFYFCFSLTYFKSEVIMRRWFVEILPVPLAFINVLVLPGQKTL